ncbi:hypothetical protein [Paenibacillus mendelii]|uniref:Uncharacterized protein n=1 Tax=Paenibacillus mendelii TaxID=206163 RepID=A0ABV6JA27_9BACL|nr:hypothetical protein [Paenibacillus mendelii]MCQ6559745.1 hypothetical protein [Paenibacillus mendelii]
MEYKTAALPSDAVARLQQLESDLSSATGDNIVLIAYAQQEGGKRNPAIYDSTLNTDRD